MGGGGGSSFNVKVKRKNGEMLFLTKTPSFINSICLITLVFLFLFANFCDTVDKSKFKTCDQVGFCK